MCIMSDTPTLVVREEGVSGGALDPFLAVDHLYGTSLEGADDDPLVRRWAADIDSLRRDRIVGKPATAAPTTTSGCSTPSGR
jgi:hypothetical protein